MPALWKSTSNAGRSRPAQQSSIRGRISGPIPIPSPGDDDEFPIRTPGSGIAIPANADENFEFPIRKPGSGIATTYPLPEDGLEVQEPGKHPQQAEQLHPLQPQAGTSAVSVSGSHNNTAQSSNATSNPEPPAQAPPEPPSESRSSSGHRAARTSPRASPPQRRSPPVQRTAPTSTLRYSTVSEAPTGQSGDEVSPKRKKSTLRTALGRLFGRKKKSRESQGSAPTSGRTSDMLSSTQHRSDPSALGRGKDGEPKRSASLPITEYDRALRSHSIGPDTITAIESARNSLQATTTNDMGATPSRKRAATTGGRPFPPYHTSSMRTGRASVEGGWAGGLSPRPASTHGRGSRVIPGELDDPSEIGRAITSDSGAGARRRSRSLSGLNDIFAAAGAGLGESRPQVVRRRSDEIKYWRESHNAGFRSPLSSNAPAEAESDREADQDQDDTKSGAVDDSVPQSPVDNDPQAQQQLPPKTPPQPFNFESITRDTVGMKITHVASMEHRIGSLEARMVRLERVVEQLCHAVPGFRTPLTEVPLPGPTSDPSPSSFAFTTSAAPPTIPAIYQTMPRDLGISQNSPSTTDDESLHRSSHFSFGEAQTYIGSLHPPSSSATGTQSLTATAPAFHASNRPTSTATVRGATSLPTLVRDHHHQPGDPSETEDDHAAALLSQLETERTARRDLEAQVAKLSQRLNTLSATMFAMVRSEGGLARAARSQDQLLQPPGPSMPTPKQSSSSPPPGAVPEPQQQQQYPQKQATLSAFDAAAAAEDEDRQTEEEFITPGEERSTLGGYGFGVFGEPMGKSSEGLVDETEGEGEDDEDEDVTENERDEAEDEADGKRRKAARTLSLSQLTLGKKGGRTVQI